MTKAKGHGRKQMSKVKLEHWMVDEILKDIQLMQGMQKLTSKQLVALVLSSFDDSTLFQDAIIEEVCTRIHPGWESESLPSKPVQL